VSNTNVTPPDQSQERALCVVRVLSGQQAGAHEPLSRGDRLVVGGDLSDDLILAGVKNARLLIRVDQEGRCLLTALRPGVTCQGQTCAEGHHLEPALPALLDLDGITLGVGPEQTDWQNLRATYQQESASTASVAPAPQPAPLGISATTIAQVMAIGLLATAFSAGLYYTHQKDEFSKNEQLLLGEKTRADINTAWAKQAGNASPLEWKALGPGWEVKAMVASGTQEAQLKKLLESLGNAVSYKICNRQQMERALAAALAGVKPIHPTREIKINSQQSDKTTSLNIPWELFPKVKPALLRLSVTDCASAELAIELRGMWFAATRQPAVFNSRLVDLNRRLAAPDLSDNYFVFLLAGANAVRQIRLDAPASVLVGPVGFNRRLGQGATLAAPEGGAKIIDITSEGVYLQYGPWIRLEAGV
jgi:hypothetical protein